MINAGINDGDIILVNSSIQAVNNSIILAEINNCICIKRIKFLNNSFVLFSENPKYPSITVKKTDNFVIWGVVLSILDKM
jgi:DNA polymerase V